LPINCRNTTKIAGTCGQILGKEIKVNSESPVGVPPVFVFAEDSAKQNNAVTKQIKDWTSLQKKLLPKQIAIITRGNIDKSSFKDIKKISGHPVVHTLREWKSNHGILLTSLYKFKGLEADALIFVDVVKPDANAPDSGFGPEHFYVGCSRAKHLLTIVSLEKNWLEF
jgi:superfamily I DNA/RNA helicase